MIEDPQVELQEEKPAPRPPRFVSVHRRPPRVGDPQRMFKATYPGFLGPQVLVPALNLSFGAHRGTAPAELLTHWSVANEAGIIEHVGRLDKPVLVNPNDVPFLNTTFIFSKIQQPT